MIRYEFFDLDVSDENIHPGGLFEHERELAYDFVSNYKIKSNINNFLFKRYNIAYYQDTYKNLVVDSDVSNEFLDAYFYDSELSRFRSSEKYQSSVTKLRSDIWKNYIEWVEGRCFRYLESTKDLKVLDVGSRYIGWIDELKQSSLLNNVNTYKPLPPITSSEETEGSNDVVIALNAIQREKNPNLFLRDLNKKLSLSGILVLSFRSGTGFDILSLKEKNKSIFPLDHLFLPSIDGIKKLLEEENFELLEVTTPGQLDAEIVKSVVEKGDCTNPFLSHMFQTTPIEEIQSFIQKNNLSSHVRVVAKKRS